MVTIRPLLIFLSLLAVYSTADPVVPPVKGSHRLLVALISILLVWTASAIVRVRTIRGLSGTRKDFVATLWWLRQSKRFLLCLACGLFGWLVWGLAWPSVVRDDVGLGWVPFVDELLILMPLLLMLVGSSLILRMAEEAADWKVHRLRFPLTDWLEWNPKIWGSVRAEHGPWILSTLFIVAVYDVAGWFERASLLVSALVALVLMAMFSLVGFPLILRVSLMLERFPAGRLRTALDQWAASQRIGVSEIFLWDPSAEVANAALTGVLPWARYVFLSRSIVEQLFPVQLLGVFGHEVGHARHHHLGHLLGVVVGGVTCSLLVSYRLVRLWLDGEPAWARWEQEAILLVTGLLAGPILFVVVGWLSRRFEHQADLDGCRAASVGIAGLESGPPPSGKEAALALEPTREGVAIFGSSLERVAIFNGMDPDRWSWRGGRLGDRVRFLERVSANPGLAREFDQRLGRSLMFIHGGLWGLLVALAALWW
jgi:Zn-dependent protease with chaperone function